jgi:hypothetical protein
MIPTTTKDQLWKQMVTLVKPYVTVSRVATRPRATTRPPPLAGNAPEPRFEGE